MHAIILREALGSVPLCAKPGCCITNLSAQSIHEGKVINVIIGRCIQHGSLLHIIVCRCRTIVVIIRIRLNSLALCILDGRQSS